MPYTVPGTNVYEYRKKLTASMTWGDWTTLATKTTPFYINNDSGVNESWDVESRHTFTPYSDLYPPAQFTKITTLTIEPTTQISFSAFETDPSDFPSGDFIVRCSYSETPAWTGGGTRVFTGTIKLYSEDDVLIVTFDDVPFTDVGGGVLESDAVTAPIYYHVSPTSKGYVKVDMVGSITASAVYNEQNDEVIADVWFPSVTPPDIQVTQHTSTLTYDPYSFEDAFKVETTVTDLEGILTDPVADFYVWMHVVFKDNADVTVLGEKDVPMPWDAGESKYIGYTGNGQELFSLVEENTKVHVQVFARMEPESPGVPVGNDTEALEGDIYRYY